MKIAVIGGGISGLAAGWRLQQAGHEVVVLEADARVGGKIRSERTEGFLVEHGPNGFLDSRTQVLDLARDLGLGDRLRPANQAAARRYLFVRGKLREAPTGPGSFLTSSILSVGGRARVFMEPFVRGKKDDVDETVFDFAARRIGREAAGSLVDPMVTGIYAGDSRALSLPAAFPRLATIEAEHGSLVKGMMAIMRARKKDSGGPAGPAGALTSFPDGLEEMTGALAARLGSAVQLGRPATRLIAGERWRVEAGGGDAIEADAVVFCTPAPQTAELLRPHAPAAVAPLLGIPYARAAVVALGFEPAGLPRPLDGFGFLVPSQEKRRVLGVLWSSTLWAGRAPDGRVLLRNIVGGVHQPGLVDLPDDALVEVVLGELAVTMGGLMPPTVFRRVVRWPDAIPQYNLGHRDRLAQAEAAVAGHRGLLLAGNALYGISLADCVSRADALPGLL